MSLEQDANSSKEDVNIEKIVYPPLEQQHFFGAQCDTISTQPYIFLPTYTTL
jgi:hypothetical protein